MKKQIFLIFLLLCLIFSGTGCIKDKNPVDGNGDNDQTIPSTMPQTDILWPSLADSPWPMFLHDPQHTGRSSYIGAQEGELEWSFPAGGEIFSSPAIGDDGTLYFGCEFSAQSLYALDPNGNEKWHFQAANKVESSPLVAANGKIYFGDNAHCFYCLNSDGTLAWKYDTEGIFCYSSPTISRDGSLIFVQVAQDFMGGKNGVFAFTPNGTLQWVFRPPESLPELVSFSPALSPDSHTLYCPGLGVLYAVDTGGKLKWAYSAGISGGAGGLASTPAVDSQGNIYFRIGELCYSVTPSGDLRWQTSVLGGTYFSSPTIGRDGTIYVVGGESTSTESNHLYALDYEGNIKWVFSIHNSSESTPVIDGEGTIYLGTWSPHGSPYAANLNFIAINPDGTEKYRAVFEGNPGIFPDIDTVPVIGANKRIYLGSDNGGHHLLCVK